MEISAGQFGAVIGHAAAKRAFADALNEGKLHHAWLMRGPRGIGKARLALQFAALLLGAKTDRSFAADDTDPVVAMMIAGSHPDFRIIRRPVDDKGKEKTEIPAESVRELKDFFALKPAMGGWRVAVLDAVDELNRFGANAILKTLEEPPARAVLILIAHGQAALLPTIRSRCRLLPMSPLSQDDSIEALERTGMPRPRAEEVSKLAPGRPGRALMLQGPEADAATAAIRDALKRLDKLSPEDLQRVLQQAGKSDAALAAAMDVLRSTVQRRATREHDPVAAGDWATAWLDVMRIDAEARDLGQDRSQAIAGALDRVAQLAGRGD